MPLCWNNLEKELFPFIMKFTWKRLFPCFAFSCFRMVEPGGGDYGKKCKRLEGKTNITGFSRIPACSQHSLTIQKIKLFLFCVHHHFRQMIVKKEKVDGADADDDD